MRNRRTESEDNETDLPSNEKNKMRKKKIGMAISVGFVFDRPQYSVTFFVLFTVDRKKREKDNFCIQRAIRP